MEGDRLARGARSAVFSVAPNLKFDEGVMRDDFKKLSQDDFITKYMITGREYTLIKFGGEERVNSFAEEMKERAKDMERALQQDERQEASLGRECFLVPYLAMDHVGRVIVAQDTPPQKRSNLALPKSMRKTRDYLPTTGHIIKAAVVDGYGKDMVIDYLNRRILFSPMSGAAICFKGFPTWRQLELPEILCWVMKEDAQVAEEEMEPMV